MDKQMARRVLTSFKTRSQCSHTLAASPGNGTSSDKRHLKQLTDIPGPGGIYGLPYIGAAFHFHPFTKFRTDQVNLFFKELHVKYGKILKFRKGKEWAVFLFDPDLIEAAMKHEGRYPKRPEMPLMETYARRAKTQRGLSLLTGKDWYAVRKPVQDCAMKPRVVAEYLPAQSEVADDLVSNIRLQQHVHDMNKLLFRYTAESTSLVCFNTRLWFLDSEGRALPPEKEELLKGVTMFMQLVAESFYTFPWFRLYKDRLYNSFAKICDDVRHTAVRYVDEIYADICQKKATGTLNLNEPNLLLCLLKDPKLPKEMCLHLITGFFTVATENVAKTLSMCLWMLAKNKDKQEKLYQEIKSQLGEGPIRPDKLAYMPYLKACVKETTRLAFPSPVGSVRLMAEDVEIAGYFIPKGTEVHFCHNILCHSPEYFDNPESFSPERWLRKDSNPAKTHHQSFIVLPFGVGARNCPGRRIAEQQLNLAIVKLLQSFKISLPDPNEELKIVYRISATKDSPLKLDFEEREK